MVRRCLLFFGIVWLLLDQVSLLVLCIGSCVVSWLAHIRGLVWLCFLLWLVLCVCVCPVWLLFGVCVVLLYVIHIDFVLLLGGF